jgi:hypothetical protein
MGAGYAQKTALGKGLKLGKLPVMPAGGNGMGNGQSGNLPPFLADPYDPEPFRAALARVMKEQGLNPHSWGERSGQSPGAIRAFLGKHAPDPEPGEMMEREPPQLTEAPRLNFFVRLAAGANVSLARLLDLTRPSPGSGRQDEPVPRPVVDLASILELAAAKEREVAALRQRNQDLEERVARLERKLK